MKRAVRLTLVVALILSAFAVFATYRSSAAPALTGKMLGDGIAAPYHGSNHIGSIRISTSSQVFTMELKWAPGAASGWHYHPGLTFVTVQSGRLTTYNKNGSGCIKITYRAGQSFFEPPRKIHNAVNNGAKRVKALYMQLGMAPQQPDAFPAPRPKNCAGA